MADYDRLEGCRINSMLPDNAGSLSLDLAGLKSWDVCRQSQWHADDKLPSKSVSDGSKFTVGEFFLLIVH